MRTVFITQIMIHKEESLFYLWEPKVHKSGIFIINVLVPQGQMGKWEMKYRAFSLKEFYSLVLKAPSILSKHIAFQQPQ